MPPKRKKSVRQKQKQRQSQSQKVIVNIGKSSTTKRRRNAGRGGLPPPSHQQNLFPPTIIQQQAPNIAVLENQISRLTSLIQEKPHIPVLNTPLSADTRTAEAQKMAGQQAEARRPGPTAENLQSLGVPFPVDPPPITSEMAGEFGVDAFGFPEPVTEGRTPVGENLQRQKDIMKTARSLGEPVIQSQKQIIDNIVAQAETDRKARQFPTLKQLAVRELTRQFSTEQLNRVRPPDPAFNQRLVNPADPPKMAGLGEGGGGLPFAESRRAGPGAPRKDTQRAIPVSPPTAPPVQADGTPITKKETKAQKAKREKAEAQEKGQKTITDFL